MPVLTMTIAAVNVPKQGSTRGSVKGINGQILGAFAEKISLFQQGKTYEIEYTENESGGRVYKNVKSAKEIGGADTTPTAAAPKVYADPEQMWVRETLTALIKAGEVKNDKRQLWEAANMLRALWRHTFVPSRTFAVNIALSRPTASQRALIERDVRRQTPASGAFFASQAGAIDELPEHSAA